MTYKERALNAERKAAILEIRLREERHEAQTQIHNERIIAEGIRMAANSLRMHLNNAEAEIAAMQEQLTTAARVAEARR